MIHIKKGGSHPSFLYLINRSSIANGGMAMRIFDISQEVFSCEVYEGDPVPKKETVFSFETGDLYQLTAFSMCAHNGTHVDAPLHFLKHGKGVEGISLEKTVGFAYVAAHEGELLAEDAKNILQKANGRSKYL